MNPLSGTPEKSAAVPKRLFLLSTGLGLLIFLSFGLLLLPWAGLEEDEVLFVYNLWHPEISRESVSIFKLRMPLILMSYLGSLKSWLFAPVFRVFGVSEWSVRVPALLLALATIAFGGLLMRQISGSLAAAVFVWLLSTDIVFLLTAVFDWGPVVLQNLLLVGGLLAFVAWWHSRRDRLLSVGSLLFGLALWDKALFLWNLCGISVSLLLLNPRTVLHVWHRKQFALVVFGLTIGAYPLIHYNLRNSATTLKDNAHLTFHEVVPKADYLRISLDGTYAQMPFADPRYHAQGQAKSWIGRAFLASTLAGPTFVSSWRSWLLIAAIPAGLLLAGGEQRRWILFFLISGVVAWFQAALTVGAGGSIHHCVLIWPLLYGSVALSISAIAQHKKKFAAQAVVVLLGMLSLRGVQTLGLAYANMLNSVRSTNWSDADKALGKEILRQGVRRAMVTDWGIAGVLAVRTGDKVAVSDLFFGLADGHFDKEQFVNCRAPDCIVVSHVEERSMDPKTSARLTNWLRTFRLEKVRVSDVSDRHGIPTFELWRIKPMSQ